MAILTRRHVSRRNSQFVIFTVWLSGLVACVVIYFVAFREYAADLPKYKLTEVANWQELVSENYEQPISGIYAPWIAVMLAAILANSGSRGRERIDPLLLFFSALVSVLFNAGFAFYVYSLMLGDVEPLDSKINIFSPLASLMLSVAGAFVTYNFPEAEPLPAAPRPNPASRTMPAGEPGPHAEESVPNAQAGTP